MTKNNYFIRSLKRVFIYQSLLMAGYYKYKMTYSTVDGSTTTGYNSTGSGYNAVATGLSSGKGGYVTRMQFGNYGLWNI